jgi:hypothetical protein
MYFKILVSGIVAGLTYQYLLPMYVSLISATVVTQALVVATLFVVNYAGLSLGNRMFWALKKVSYSSMIKHFLMLITSLAANYGVFTLVPMVATTMLEFSIAIQALSAAFSVVIVYGLLSYIVNKISTRPNNLDGIKNKKRAHLDKSHEETLKKLCGRINSVKKVDLLNQGLVEGFNAELAAIDKRLDKSAPEMLIKALTAKIEIAEQEKSYHSLCGRIESVEEANLLTEGLVAGFEAELKAMDKVSNKSDAETGIQVLAGRVEIAVEVAEQNEAYKDLCGRIESVEEANLLTEGLVAVFEAEL